MAVLGVNSQTEQKLYVEYQGIAIDKSQVSKMGMQGGCQGVTKKLIHDIATVQFEIAYP